MSGVRQSRVVAPRNVARLGPLDPRDHGWREDLADIALAEMVAVPHYAEPLVMRVTATRIALHAEADGPAVSELLHGERFAVLDIYAGRAWGYGLHDRYVGYLPVAALAGDAPGDWRMIGPADALVLAAPDVKAAALAVLPMGGELCVEPEDACFWRIMAGPHMGGFVHGRHLLAAGGDATLDWVTVAGRYQGAPYRWGGRSRAGIDCSGLVQMARSIAGRPTRRDSDMQAADAGAPVSDAGRGAIACWPGHIGILLGEGLLLHANAYWMACVTEPLADVVARAGAEPQLHRLP